VLFITQTIANPILGWLADKWSRIWILVVGGSAHCWVWSWRCSSTINSYLPFPSSFVESPTPLTGQLAWPSGWSLALSKKNPPTSASRIRSSPQRRSLLHCWEGSWLTSLAIRWPFMYPFFQFGHHPPADLYGAQLEQTGSLTRRVVAGYIIHPLFLSMYWFR